MNRKIEIVKNCLAELLHYLIILAVDILILLLIVEKWPGILSMLLLAMIPMFYYAIRERCNSISLFFLLHLLPLILFWIFPELNTFQRVILTINVAYFMICSILRRRSSKKTGKEAIHPGFAAGVIFVLYMIDSFQAQGLTGKYLILITIAYIFIYFIYYYLNQFLNYIDINSRNTENMPVKKSFYSATTLTVGYSAAALFIITLITSRELWDIINKYIITGILKILRFLAGLIPETQPSQQEIINIVPEGIEEIAERQEPVMLSKILEVLLQIFTIAILILLAIGLIVGLINFIKQMQLRRKKWSHLSDDLHGDKVEELGRKEGSREKRDRELWFAVTPEQRIRKYFVHTMKKRTKGEDDAVYRLLMQATARECCEQLFPDKKPEAVEMARLYEKARYAQGVCSREEAQKAKLLAAVLQGKRKG